jgi:hypothetical protein
MLKEWPREQIANCNREVAWYNTSTMQPVDLSAMLEQCKGQWGSPTPSDGVISADKSPKKA